MNNANSTNTRTEVQRLLRCRKTRQYFSGGGWTPHLAGAKIFPSQFDAVVDCIAHRLIDVDLVLRCPGAEGDLFTTSIR